MPRISGLLRLASEHRESRRLAPKATRAAYRPDAFVCRTLCSRFASLRLQVRQARRMRCDFFVPALLCVRPACSACGIRSLPCVFASRLLPEVCSAPIGINKASRLTLELRMSSIALRSYGANPTTSLTTLLMTAFLWLSFPLRREAFSLGTRRVLT